MKHVAIYTRVSSKPQDTASQEPDLASWEKAYANGRPVVRYTDKASGKTMDRPGWKKLEAEIDAGRVDTVVVWRLDRLGRTAAGLTALFEKLQHAKVNLVSVRDSVDLSTAAGRLMANVIASVAAYDNELRSERVRAGQAVARANGKRWGGSPKGKRKKVTRKHIKQIHRMKAEGTPITEIAELLKLSRPTVYSVLREEAA